MQMPLGVPARVVILCILMFGVPIAHAERRPVAVIALSEDPTTTKLAADLFVVLLGHPELQPITDATIPPELYGPFRDDDFDRIAAAVTAKHSAEAALVGYRFELAHQSAGEGQNELHRVNPTAAVLALYAQLSFVRGQALLGIPAQAAEAPIELARAHRLDPTFAPDPARYLPDVVQAFDAAKKRWTGKGTLSVVGHGRLWIDGRETGTAPADVEVDAGPHVVWLTGADRVTAGDHAIVVAGKKTTLEIKDLPASAALKVRRGRAALRYAPDPAARAGAMRTLAELVNVRDAVLLTSVNGRVVVQTWNAGARKQAPGFSPLRELKDEQPIDLLTPLAPPKPKVVDTGPTEPPPRVVDERRWYQRRTWQATLAVGVLAAIVGSYYIYQAATDNGASLDPDPTNGDGTSVLRW